MPDIGLREILMIAVAATAAYLLLSVLRLVQISRRKSKALAAAKAVEAAPAGEEESLPAMEEPLFAREPEPAIGDAPAEPAPDQAPAGKRKHRWLPQWVKADAKIDVEAEDPGLAPEEEPTPFSKQLFRSNLEAEVQHLRSDVAGLREELKLLKAARRVSPQYNEAMMLAQRGIDAQGIADQCGISVGEAELVLALSRNKQEYEDYGEDDPRRSAG